jgi:V8-like Glu-specific endopeptidase
MPIRHFCATAVAVLVTACTAHPEETPEATSEAGVRAATLQVLTVPWAGAVDEHNTLPQIAGTAFRIGPSQYVTAAHIIRQFIDGRYLGLELQDVRRVRRDHSRPCR